MSQRRQIILFVALGFVLVALNLWAWSILSEHRQAAADADRDVAVCRQLANRIAHLKDKPTVAGSREIEATELSQKIERAATANQIAPAALTRISPESARRVGDTSYLEKPTTVLLSGISLRQLADFLYAMSTGSSVMSVQRIWITAPRDEGTSDRWTVEVTLSYLIYAPRPSSASPQSPEVHTALNAARGES